MAQKMTPEGLVVGLFPEEPKPPKEVKNPQEPVKAPAKKKKK